MAAEQIDLPEFARRARPLELAGRELELTMSRELRSDVRMKQ
jgi:hypothetical protein